MFSPQKLKMGKRFKQTNKQKVNFIAKVYLNIDP